MATQAFTSIHLEEIGPDLELPGSLYLFISGKFIEYKMQGDVVPASKYDQFIMRKMKYLFVKEDEVAIFRKWIGDSRNNELELLATITVGDDQKKLVKLKQNIKRFMVDIFSSEMQEEKISNVAMSTRSFIQEMSSNVVPDMAWSNLSSLSKNIVDHSMNVALMSIFLADQVGFGQQKIRENLFLGSIFHDYGKSLFDHSLYEAGNEDALKKEMIKHPEMGKNALSSSPSLNQEVLRIIEEHHENYDGSGYPAGKKKSMIYDLSKIVSVANEFDHLVQNGHGSHKERAHDAMDELSRGAGNKFDPDKLQKCLKALKLIF
ncbi:MAG: HD domain-containing protein [Bacteriovoracaceae bacterium]|nr:HD domain-containing protein [Bacteriovoracaceae bacterium]